MKNSDLNNDYKLREIFGHILLDDRTLQSMAFHLELDIDIEKTDVEIIKDKVVDCLSRNPSRVDDPHLKRLATSQKIELIHFSFLSNYSRALVLNKLMRSNLFSGYLLEPSFDRSQSINITVGYIVDREDNGSRSLSRQLNDLEKKLNKMGKMLKRAKWFESDIKKMEVAKYIFAKKGYLSHINGFLINAEIFFLNEEIVEADKELIFKEIRAKYNLEESRKSNPKKQCNFSLDPDAYAVMEKLREGCGLKRSEFLEAIFAPENKIILKKMIERKILSPKYYKASSPLPTLAWDPKNLGPYL